MVIASGVVWEKRYAGLGRFKAHTVIMIAFLVGVFLLAVTTARPQANTNSPLLQGIQHFRIGQACLDRASLSNSVSFLEAACKAAPESYEAHYWLGTAQFHVLLAQLGHDGAEITDAGPRQTVADASATLERALQLRDGDGETHALLSTLKGMSIAHEPKCALVRGRAAMKHKKIALKSEPENPRVHYLVGMSRFHAPRFLGGKKGALAALKEADELYQAEQKRSRNAADPAWGHIHCLAFIGESYRALGKKTEAEPYYRRALALNASHKLAKEGLQKCSEEGTE